MANINNANRAPQQFEEIDVSAVAVVAQSKAELYRLMATEGKLTRYFLLIIFYQ